MTDIKHETKQNTSHTPGPWYLTVDNQQSSTTHDIATIYGTLSQPTEDGRGQRWLHIGVNKPCFEVSPEGQEANARLIAASPDLLEAAEQALSRFAWVIDTVSHALCHMNVDDLPQEAIELLDEVTTSEYFKDDIEQLQLAIAEAKGLAA